MVQSAKAEPGAQDLALGPLAAIDQKPARSPRDVKCRQASVCRRDCRRGTEKHQFEHNSAGLRGDMWGGTEQGNRITNRSFCTVRPFFWCEEPHGGSRCIGTSIGAG